MGIFSKKVKIDEAAQISFFRPDDSDDPDYCFIDLDICGTGGKRCKSCNNFKNTSIFDIDETDGLCEYKRLCDRLINAGYREVEVTWILKDDKVKRCLIDYQLLANAFGESWLADLEEAGWLVEG